MNVKQKSRYHEVHARSLSDPEGFWAEAAREIDWIEPPKKIFDASMGTYGRWFAGGVVIPVTTRSTAMSQAGAAIRSR
jgi:propionyl-CoA synthetase